jgi:hypothetical protein
MGHKGHTIEEVVYGMPAPAGEAGGKRLAVVKARVTVEELEAWKAAAWDRRVSLSELVRTAMRELLERQTRPAATSSPTLDELLERIRA